MSLPDIQKTVDTRGIAIDKVGVTGIKMPVRLLRKPFPDETIPVTMDTVGKFEMSCSLPASVKGTHMSRFTEVLNEHIDGEGIFSHDQLQVLARKLAERLEAARVYIYLEVDYFIEQFSPATKKRGVAPLSGGLSVTYHAYEDKMYCTTGIIVSGKTCCPCSREISEYDHETGKGKGAHAQRGEVAIVVHHQPADIVWFEDLAEAAMKGFSSPVYPILKRPDERHVTMAAYANPKFVEDVGRDVAAALYAMDTVEAFKVTVKNAESIHYHDAICEIRG